MCVKCDGDLISRDDVKKAIRMLNIPTEYLNCTALQKQLADSLEVYLDRGEFTGSLKSAIECLTMAQYEIEGVNS